VTFKMDSNFKVTGTEEGFGACHDDDDDSTAG
jgi:hypothetical protein